MSSIMSELADEVLKPVKTGLFIGSAVIVVGGLAVAANSKMGRKFLGNVKDAVTGSSNADTKPDETSKDGSETIIDVEVEQNQEVIENNPQPDTETKKEITTVGVDNV